MTDTPLRIRLWADMAMHLDAAQFGLEMDANPTRASVEYVRADLVPQPQEPTDAEVEAAARAIIKLGEDEEGETGWWETVGECERGLARALARAALIAARKAGEGI